MIRLSSATDNDTIITTNVDCLGRKNNTITSRATETQEFSIDPIINQKVSPQ
jgi:hypothetical protein